MLPNGILILAIATTIITMLNIVSFVRFKKKMLTMWETTNHVQNLRMENCSWRIDVAHKALDKLRGKFDKTHISSKIAEKTATQASALALDALSRTIGVEKSTHQVQFITAEQMLSKNTAAKKHFDKVLNPSDEEFDWMNPVLSENNENA